MAGVKDALSTGRVLTLEDVNTDFNKYNFIITLNNDVVDTTIYNGSHHHTGQIVGVIPASGNPKWLVLTTEKISGATIGNTEVKANETRIVIFDKCVTDIKVKSTRNFLLNQN